MFFCKVLDFSKKEIRVYDSLKTMAGIDEDDMNLLRLLYINKFITLALKLIFMCLTLHVLHYWYHQKCLPEEGRAEGLEGDVPCPVASERLCQLWDFCLLSE